MSLEIDTKQMLDTTRVIERLTQARLSRFHSTGAAGIQQNSSNLDILLHPHQSTRRPQMVIRFDKTQLKTESAQAVIRHVQGKIMHTTIGTFLNSNIVVCKPLPNKVIALMSAVYEEPIPPCVIGFRMNMEVQAMVWHNVGVEDVVDAIGRTASTDVFSLPMWIEKEPCIFITTRQLIATSADHPSRWTQSLPDLPSMLQHNQPCIADIFCAPREDHGISENPCQQTVRLFMA